MTSPLLGKLSCPGYSVLEGGSSDTILQLNAEAISFLRLFFPCSRCLSWAICSSTLMLVSVPYVPGFSLVYLAHCFFLDKVLLCSPCTDV